MNELLSGQLWKTIRKLGKKAARRRAAISYVTNDRHVAFGDGDVLVTDASDGAIAAGQTSAIVLAKAHKRGATLYSVAGLHCKVMLLDGTAIIGSANLSESSEANLIEAAWVTDSPASVGMATSFVEQLAAKAEHIDESFLTRIQRIKVRKTGYRGRKGANQSAIKVSQPRTWIIGLHELKKEFPDEAESIEKGMERAKENLAQR